MKKLRKLKSNHLYYFIGSGIFEGAKETVKVTNTYTENDKFRAYSLDSERRWMIKLADTKGHWAITEMGPVSDYPEYFL